MGNTVETFRGISLLIFKWLLFALLGIVAILLAVWGVSYAHRYLTYDRHAAKVVVGVRVSKLGADAFCAKSAQFPLFVGIVNNSSKTIEKVRFSLEARRKGYSTDLADYHTYTSDKIIGSKDVHASCWRAPLGSDAKYDPRELEWKASDIDITFE